MLMYHLIVVGFKTTLNIYKFSQTNQRKRLDFEDMLFLKQEKINIIIFIYFFQKSSSHSLKPFHFYLG